MEKGKKQQREQEYRYKKRRKDKKSAIRTTEKTTRKGKLVENKGGRIER